MKFVFLLLWIVSVTACYVDEYNSETTVLNGQDLRLSNDQSIQNQADIRPNPSSEQGGNAWVNPTDMKIHDSDNTMIAPTCREVLDVGAICQADLDCCGPNSTCLLDQDFWTCHRTCDAHLSPNGCGLRELCVPIQTDIPFDQPSLGNCIKSDGCVPGRENEACGAGHFTCVRIENISNCLDLSLFNPNDIKGINQNCDQDHPCQSGMVCEYNVCRSACQSNGTSCNGNLECLDYTERTDGVQYQFCMDTCDVYRQNCSTDQPDLTCIFLDAYEDRPLGECFGGLPKGSDSAGDSCTMNEYYWGSCKASNFCVPLENDPSQGECVALCDRQNLDRCNNHSACVTNIFTQTALEELGLCYGSCDPFTNAYDSQRGYFNRNCPNGEACYVTYVGLGSTTQEKVIGECKAFALDSVGEDENCIVTNEDTGDSNCAPNMVCSPVVENGPNVCTKFCQLGNGLADCEQNDQCQVGSIDGANSLGFCLP
jgi:hypothetical protein